ncbi:uncharacterized protein At1g08160-like [Telopea speciosissima]|uniref:uncharacterized protein At1g08160-like n=1 Tax=Telopea speciosissima TaxID=54955 RepID=UPI001CC63F90|nr:uncharacterized protein At1g08160-like [Telopea speciosissima]
MANPARRPTNTTPTRRSKLIKCIATTIITLCVLIAIAILIAWAIIRPKRLVYTIENGSVHGYDLKYKHLNSSFNFVLKAYNPNKKVSVFYNSMQVSVLYDDEPIAFDTVEPFFQSHHNVTLLQLKPVAHSVPLMESEIKDLKLERSSGVMELTIKVKGKVRLKVGSWKSKERKLRVSCYPVDLHFSSSKSFERTKCVSHI